jgi:hypothetical protein
MQNPIRGTAMPNPFWRSSTALRLLQGTAVVGLLLLAGTAPLGSRTSDLDRDTFLRETMQRWCASNGASDDLQAAIIDVRFHAEPPAFKPEEGAVVAPIAVDLPGAQRVLNVASQPAHLRKVITEGITTLAWEYGGRAHRDMRFTGIALVQRPPLVRVTLPERPTFDSLPPDLRPEAMSRARDTEEHDLNKCAAFAAWTAQSGGAPPHTSQIVRLVHAVAKRAEEKKGGEDLCADIREGRFTPHRAQVAVVMAARELGIPAFGFAAASDRDIYLVGTYTDQAGWILMNVERPEEGWFTGGPVLVSMAPLLGGSSASQHGFWYPVGAAYSNGQWGVDGFSTTEWRGRSTSKTVTNTTEARTIHLAEMCR